MRRLLVMGVAMLWIGALQAQEVVYKIEVSGFDQPLKKRKIKKEFGPVTQHKDHGKLVYRIGAYRTYQESSEKSDELRKMGYSSAKIVMLQNEEEISLEQWIAAYDDRVWYYEEAEQETVSTEELNRLLNSKKEHYAFYTIKVGLLEEKLPEEIKGVKLNLHYTETADSTYLVTYGRFFKYENAEVALEEIQKYYHGASILAFQNNNLISLTEAKKAESAILSELSK